MHVVSVCPLRVASLVWQPFPGGWTMTVVVKATYQLAPNESALAESQEYVQEEENHWNDDSEHSLYAPSDLVPLKPSPEVMLVGHAFAPGAEPVTRLLVHLVVGEVDKSIEIRADQSFLRDGALREGPRFARMPLRYERAAGGPGTQNPVGMQIESANTLGVVQLPNLRPPGSAVVKVGDFIEPVGFGPIAAAWPTRRQRLGRHAGHWSEAALAREPVPDGIDPHYFMSGPRDQALARLRPDERIVLENLCAGHPRLATNLPGIEPRAFVEVPQQAPTELGLVCDTLWIDTDRSICTLTWRGQVQLQRPQQEGRVVVAMEKSGRPLSWAEVEPLTRGQHDQPEDVCQTIVPRRPQVSSAALPFGAPSSRGWSAPAAGAATGRPPVAEEHPGDMTAPFGNRQADAAVGPAWLSRPRQGAAAPVAAPGLVSMPPPSAPIALAAPAAPVTLSPAPASMSSLLAAPVQMPAPVAPARVSPPVQPAPSPAQMPAPVAPARASSPWAVGPGPAGSALAGFGAAPMTFLAPGAPGAPSADLRDAAASSAAATPASGRGADAAGSTPAHAQTGAREHVDLLWFDPAAVPKIRASAAQSRDPAPQASSVSWLKEGTGPRTSEAQETKDRRDVLRVLTRTPPVAEEALSHAISAAFRDDGAFDPPVTVVAGELSFVFDEIEALKATITVTTPFIGTDRKLRELVTAATEVLKAEWPAPADVAEGFTLRIEEAFGQGPRAVAPGYLQGSVKRMLLEARSYQKKTVYGERRIRALMSLAGGRAPIPAYLPEALGPRLPLYLRFRASAIVEPRPQEDQYETHGDALVVLALGRLLRERG